MNERPLYTHLVQVHPVENGETNFEKVEAGFEYDEIWQADHRVALMNEDFEALNLSMKAVYAGCVNNETGEVA